MLTETDICLILTLLTKGANMLQSVTVPMWARNSKSEFLLFLSQYGALQFSAKGGVQAWCDSCGISASSVLVSINRGYFTQRIATKLSESLEPGVLDPLWLIAPERFMISEVDADGN